MILHIGGRRDGARRRRILTQRSLRRTLSAAASVDERRCRPSAMGSATAPRHLRQLPAQTVLLSEVAAAAVVSCQ